MLVTLLSVALAGTVQVELRQNADGVELLSAYPIRGRADLLPATVFDEGLAVRDRAGHALFAWSLPETVHRSVVYPEGGGDAAAQPWRHVSVRVPWPDGADSVTYLDQVVPLSPAPPPNAIAVLESGPPDQRLDLVILGDGYGDSQDQKFAADVDRLVDYLLTVEPYSRYSELFNIWRVPLGGGGSPGDGGPGSDALGCYYGCAGIDRLMCCDGPVISNASAAVPGYDGVLVLVNSNRYGGSGGFDFAVSYTGTDFGVQVAAHELGHTLIGLWDEYSYGTTGGFQSDGPNCAGDKDNTPWESWVGTDGVGAFKTCSYTDFYRPTDVGCMMNTLQDGYCDVCREAAVLAIHDRIPNFVQVNSPEAGATITLAEGDPEVPFEVEVVGDAYNYDISWQIDGEEVASGADFSLRDCSGLVGELRLVVTTESDWVRDDPEGALVRSSGPWYVDTPGEGCPTALDDLFASCGCQTGALPALPGLALILAVFGIRRRRA